MEYSPVINDTVVKLFGVIFNDLKNGETNSPKSIHTLSIGFSNSLGILRILIIRYKIFLSFIIPN